LRKRKVLRLVSQKSVSCGKGKFIGGNPFSEFALPALENIPPSATALVSFLHVYDLTAQKRML